MFADPRRQEVLEEVIDPETGLPYGEEYYDEEVYDSEPEELEFEDAYEPLELDISPRRYGVGSRLIRDEVLEEVVDPLTGRPYSEEEAEQYEDPEFARQDLLELDLDEGETSEPVKMPTPRRKAVIPSLQSLASREVYRQDPEAELFGVNEWTNDKVVYVLFIAQSRESSMPQLVYYITYEKEHYGPDYVFDYLACPAEELQDRLGASVDVNLSKVGNMVQIGDGHTVIVEVGVGKESDHVLDYMYDYAKLEHSRTFKGIWVYDESQDDYIGEARDDKRQAIVNYAYGLRRKITEPVPAAPKTLRDPRLHADLDEE